MQPKSPTIRLTIQKLIASFIADVLGPFAGAKSVAALRNAWLSPISGGPLATLRVLFGIVMLGSTIRFVALGWVADHFIDQSFRFHYWGFGWVPMAPPWLLYGLHGILCLASIGLIFNRFYRFSAWLLFLCFTYTELLDLTYYLNHYYFVSLVAFLFCLAPKVRAGQPVPYWSVAMFRIVAGLLYVYAGFAKLDSEWLLDALPLRIWLPAGSSIPILAPIVSQPWAPYAFAWGGMVYDSTIVFFLMWRRSAWLAYAAVVVFHTVVGLLFPIGVFPVVMMLVAPLFFHSGWHQKLWAWGGMALPSAGRLVESKWYVQPILIAFLAFQIAFPWRYVLYPGNLLWTEEGYRFSWRVMLVEKAGQATFYIKDRLTGRTGMVDNAEFLKPHQEKQMAFQPDMILQFAHFLHQHYTAKGMHDPIVRCTAYVTYNGRPSAPLIDSTTNLAKQTDSWAHKPWVLDAPE